MILNRSDLETFLKDLPSRIREEKVWPAAPGSGESGHDQIALAIKRWLVDDSKDILHGEGLLHHGIPVIPRKYKGGFGGSWNSPDIALLHPNLKVAIEVDRGRGKGGASVRTAMTKGMFSVLTGQFDRCLVLVFQQSGCELVLDENDKMVLAKFSTDFGTDVCFFVNE